MVLNSDTLLFSDSHPDLFLCNLSQQRCSIRRIPLDWMVETVVFLDGLLLIAEHIKYTRSREDYQDSFTLSSLLFLKTSAASTLWQRETKCMEMLMPSFAVVNICTVLIGLFKSFT